MVLVNATKKQGVMICNYFFQISSTSQLILESTYQHNIFLMRKMNNA
jgi:hypothetical protein